MNSYGESSTRFAATPGELFAVELNANPTTGYDWTCEYDRNRLELVDEAFFPAEEQATLGGQGLHRFVFESKSFDESELTFQYGRSWESTIVRTHRIMVNNVRE